MRLLPATARPLTLLLVFVAGIGAANALMMWLDQPFDTTINLLTVCAGGLCVLYLSRNA